MIEKQLLKIAESQTEKVENDSFDYYYQCNDYKFYNSYLAHWYSKKTGHFPRFVANNPIKQIRKQLKTNVDTNYNYDRDYLKDLRKQNNNLQLFLSGGTDSCTVLHKAHQNNIVFDEVISVIVGNNTKSKENLEIYKNAIPFAEKYKEAYKKFTILSINEKDLENFYSDPYVLFKTLNYENTLPFFRQFWNQEKNIEKGTKIFAVDKPRLMYYQNSWYAISFDEQISSYGGRLTNNNILRFWLEPKNIKSYIKDALNYRSFILKNNMLKHKKLEFFQMYNKNDINFGIIDKVQVIDQKSIYQKLQPNNLWNQKDQLFLTNVIKNHNVSLLTKYFCALENILSVHPIQDNRKNILFDAQIVWAINIDTLEVFSQEELIPNGFEL